MGALHLTIVGFSVLFAAYLVSLRGGHRTARLCLAVAFVALALQQGALTLSTQTGWPGLIVVRACLASVILLAFFAHFPALVDPTPFRRRSNQIWLAVPVLLTAGVIGWGTGPWLDLALAGLALALALRLACLGGFPDRRLGAWKWTGCSILVLFGLVDMATAFELWPADAPSRSNALAAGLALLVGGLVYLAFLSLHQSGPLAWLSFVHRVQPVTDDTALHIEAVMQRDQPWKDPDLTLARLARRLTLTQRQLSGYINIRHAMGFRQWLGTFRVEEAKRLMRAEPRRPLVELMLDAGFQTRSSFNQVFKDITGQTPSEWRRGAIATPDAPAPPARSR